MQSNSLFKILKSALLIILLSDSLICKSQETSFYQVYSGNIVLDGDVRKFNLEFEKKDPSMIRWSIENAGRHRIPLINPLFDKLSNSFSGDITFFGSGVFGAISGTLVGDKVNGHIIWHGDTVLLSLNYLARQLPYKEEEVSFRNGDVNLRGTLVLPIETIGPYPTVVFAHGSGSATRWWGMYWASELSQIGVATLLYDKRGCGESQGDWRQSTLDDLASDIVSAIKVLQQNPSIDKNRIGIYGVSQGGWVASRVSAMTNNLAFVIVNSGGGIKPSDEEIFSYDLNMKFAGINEKGREEGIKLVKKYFQYLGSGEGRSELSASMKAAKNEPWYPVLGLERILVSDDNRKNWEWVSTYDPKDDIREMKMPVLLMFGDQDINNPTDISVMNWTNALDEAGNDNYQVNIFKGAGHGLTVGGHHTKGFPKYAEGHVDILKDWFNQYVIKKNN